MRKAMLPLLIVFLIVNTLALVVLRQRLDDNGVDTDLIIGGNLVLFIVSIFSVWMYTKSTAKKNAHAIVRNVYGGFMLKFFVLIVAAMVYFYFAKEINKKGILICMGLYVLYSFLGTAQVVKKKAK